MRVLNFGSMNIDCVYQMDHFIQPGETYASTSLNRLCGGKGLNQSIALAQAGMPVFHACKVGADGDFLVEKLKEKGVKYVYKMYGSEDEALYHVFHLTVQEETGQKCNDEECAFFREQM